MTSRAGAALALAIAGLALGLYAAGRQAQARHDRAVIEAARAQSRTDHLNVEGAQAQARRVDRFSERRRAVQQVVLDTLPPILSEEIGHAPLDAVLVDRLRRADQRLCGLEPELKGCAGAASGASGTSSTGL